MGGGGGWGTHAATVGVCEDGGGLGPHSALLGSVSHPVGLGGTSPCPSSLAGSPAQGAVGWGDDTSLCSWVTLGGSVAGAGPRASANSPGVLPPPARWPCRPGAERAVAPGRQPSHHRAADPGHPTVPGGLAGTSACWQHGSAPCRGDPGARRRLCSGLAACTGAGTLMWLWGRRCGTAARAPRNEAFPLPKSSWVPTAAGSSWQMRENQESAASRPALAWGCAVCRAGAGRAASVVALSSFLVARGSCKFGFPATWAQCGRGHRIPATKPGWRAALGTRHRRHDAGIARLAPANAGDWWCHGAGGHIGGTWVGVRGLQRGLGVAAGVRGVPAPASPLAWGCHGGRLRRALPWR